MPQLSLHRHADVHSHMRYTTGRMPRILPSTCLPPSLPPSLPSSLPSFPVPFSHSTAHYKGTCAVATRRRWPHGLRDPATLINPCYRGYHHISAQCSICACASDYAAMPVYAAMPQAILRCFRLQCGASDYGAMPQTML